MLSEQGNEILRDLYDAFRQRYLKSHPGCNENEVERAFLSEVATYVSDCMNELISRRIEALR